MNDESTRRDSGYEQNGFSRSLASSSEYMDVEEAPCPSTRSSNNNSNEHQFTIPRSANQTKNGNVASDESGIDVESPFRRRGHTVQRDDSAYNHDEESSSHSEYESSDIEEVAVAHSTPKAKTTKATKFLKIPLNIYKIDLEKVDEAIDKSDTTKIGKTNNKERIAFMIDSNKPKRKRQRGLHQSILPRVYELQRYQGQFDRNNKFELELYRKFTFSTDNETGDDMTNLHKLRFLHRNDSEAEEIFALPSGSSRNVVLKWADTNFPLSVASATLDGESVTEKEVKNLFDNRYLSRFKMKKGEPLNATSEFHLRFAPRVYTKFNAKINKSNGELKRILGHSAKAEVKMQVQLESVAFPGGVSNMNEYSKICEKLSAIYGNQKLHRSRHFDNYLSKVSKNRKVELEKQLLTELEQYFRLTAPSSDKLKHFSIATKDSTEYFGSSSIEVYYRKARPVKTFDGYVQLEHFHPIFRRNEDLVRSFAKRLDSLKISVVPKDGERRVKEKFLNCLEGILYDDTMEKDYWRVGGDWYEVSLKYSFDVYIEYNRILKASLMPKCESPLTIVWPLKTNIEFPKKEEGTHEKAYRESVKLYKISRFGREGDYCKLYESGFPSIIVTDAIIAPDGIEICDLFEFVINPNGEYTFQLHHIKKAFGADGYRVAIWQIIFSAVSLLNALNCQQGNKKSSAYMLFEYVRKKASVPIADYEEFEKKLRNATYVFSPIFASGVRDLDDEPLIKYDFSDFEKQIQPAQIRESLKRDLEPYLLKNKFIHPDGEFTTKWFEACSVKRDGGFAREKVPGGLAIDHFPNGKYMRCILKQFYYKTVDALAVKQLIVYMSEKLRNMGFGLKICQIEGEEDELLAEYMDSG